MSYGTELVAIRELLIKEVPFAKSTESEEHVRVRCPICGDSTTNQSAVHCYISVKQDMPIMYYCFKCNNGGFINSTLIRNLGIYNIKAISFINRYNNIFRRAKGYTKHKINGKSLSSKISRVPIIRYPNVNIGEKKEYVEKRLGINLTYEDCSELKIVLSLEDFLKKNNLSLNPKMNKVCYYLEKDYVGFLSTRNDYITFRNIRSTDKKFRYIIYPVYENSEDSNKFYTIPNDVDIMANDIDLHMTEGCFDILGSYFNVNECKRENSIYTAVCGGGFYNILQLFIGLGFIKNLNVKIYSDSDHPLEYYKKIQRELSVYYKSLEIMYNKTPGEKDIGVPKDKIDLTHVKL